MSKGRTAIPVLTPAFYAAEPDGMLFIEDVMEIFGYSSRNALQVCCCKGSFPKLDAYRGASVAAPAMWSYATINAEIVRRIERFGVTV